MEINLSTVKRKTISIEEEVYRVDHCSWMDLYKEDYENNRVIDISDPRIIVNFKSNKDSLLNSRFNVPSDVDNKIVEYCCECERLFGRYNDGEICPDCNTKVEVRYSNELLKRGWIDLHEFKIIIPAMYQKLKSYFGRKRLEEIINIDSNVFYDPNKIDSANPFKGIGILELERRYVEILGFFKNITKKPELFDILLKRKDITFSSKILVLTTALRPAYISTKTRSFSYHDVNKSFVTILTDLSLILKGKRTGRKALEVLGNIQNCLIDIYHYSIMKIHGKMKLIRNNIISGRMWYSARMVIVSETSNLSIDCVRMSYKGFLGMFELEIINMMLRGYGNPEFARFTTAECRIYLKKCKYSTVVDEYIMSIIDTLVHKRKDDGIWVIIGRNPSFDLGSIQCFKVADVFRDCSKNILTIPHNSLVEFSGDYDGDILNVFSPKEKCVIEAFKEGFKPSKLILDRSGGYFNTNMAPIKDEYAFLKSFFDKEYKPIDSFSEELRIIEDISQDFEFKSKPALLAALREFERYRNKMATGNYAQQTTKKYDPITDRKEPEKVMRINESIDPLDEQSDGKLKYDLFSHIDRSMFVPAVDV